MRLDNLYVKADPDLTVPDKVAKAVVHLEAVGF
jgi:hypothetical protein